MTAPPDQSRTRRLANAIRALSMDAVENAKSGHPGLPLGMADAATVLFGPYRMPTSLTTPGRLPVLCATRTSAGSRRAP